MIAGPCWNWSVFPAYHLLRQNARWHLNFDKKKCGFIHSAKVCGYYFLYQASSTLASEMDSFLSFPLHQQFPFSETARCPWEPQTSGPKTNHLFPEKTHQKQCAWQYWPPEVERQTSFQLQPFLESASKASHGDLQELDVHLTRCQHYILTNNI